MSFASPIWLIGLVPWVGLALWLLIGHRERAAVPFVSLWRNDTPPPKTHRSLRLPPLPLVLMLAAVLLAIVGAAGPSVRDPRDVARITVIVDRDVTSSANVEGADALRTMTEFLGYDIRKVLESPRTRIIAVPGGDLGEWGGRSDSLYGARRTRPSSLRTRDILHAAIRHELEQSDNLVIVLSAQNLDLVDDDLIQVMPFEPLQNVGLVRVDARELPSPKVMAVVRNQSQASAAELIVRSDNHWLRQPIELPAAGKQRSYFIEMPDIGQVISVELVTEGGVAADNSAWLIRQRSWPRIEPRIRLSAELERMIEIYQRHRKPGPQSKTVAITEFGTPLSPGAPAVVLSAYAIDPPLDADAPLRVEDHTVTADVDWSAVLPDARGSGDPGAGWRPLVRSGERVLVADRESPARQVWVGFVSDDFPRRPEFVVFWTNVFDWLGEGRDEYVWEPVTQLGPEWVRDDALSGGPPLPIEPPPGVYGRADGALRALNAIDIDVSGPSGLEWRDRIPAQARRVEARIRFDHAAYIAALVCCMVAAMFWAATARSAVGKAPSVPA